jgi:hypothetical protein
VCRTQKAGAERRPRRMREGRGLRRRVRGRAAVANQLINTRLRAIELERKIRETEELEARLAALERSEEGDRQWGI